MVSTIQVAIECPAWWEGSEENAKALKMTVEGLPDAASGNDGVTHVFLSKGQRPQTCKVRRWILLIGSMPILYSKHMCCSSCIIRRVHHRISVSGDKSDG